MARKSGLWWGGAGRALCWLLLGVLAMLLSGCLNEPTVELTFVNESDFELCFFVSSASATRADYCSEVKASGRLVSRPECGAAGKQPLTVVLTLGQGGREVYNQTATCDEWDESGGEIVIEERGGGLVATDSLSRPAR